MERRTVTHALAAEKLGVATRTIERMLRDGRLKAIPDRERRRTAGRGSASRLKGTEDVEKACGLPRTVPRRVLEWDEHSSRFESENGFPRLLAMNCAGPLETAIK